MGFQDEMNTAQKSMGGGDWFKFREGDNKMRIMSEPTIKVSRFGFGICYEGAPYCQKATLDRELAEAKEKAKAAGNKDWNKVTIKMPSQKWSAWAILRGDKEKGQEDSFILVDLPYKISKALLELMTSDEAGFKGFPMPYDINIKAKGVGAMSVEYSLIPSRTNTDVTDVEMEELGKLTPVVQILDKMKAKQKEKTEGGGTSSSAGAQASDAIEYPTEDINPDDIPF